MVRMISVETGCSAAELAALDAGQKSDHADQMLVDGEVMIHVELHHRHHAAEVGDEMAEHARLVHAAQGQFGIAGVGQQPHEHAVGRRAVAQAVIDAPEIGADLAQHLR